MRGSKKGKKTHSENQFKEKSKVPQSSSTKGGTPPSPKMQCTTQGSEQGNVAHTGQILGQACELLYGTIEQPLLSGACQQQQYIQQPQQPQIYQQAGNQHPPQQFQQQFTYQPLQAPQIAQSSQKINSNVAPTIHTGNQSESPVKNAAMNNNVSNNGKSALQISETPQWVNILMKNIDSRLQCIETQISNQNQKWQYIETQLQNQNQRMVNIEQRFSQMNEVKQSVTKVQSRLSDVEDKVKTVQSQMHDYDQSVQYYNDLCDDITEESTENKTRCDEINKRMSQLEINNSELKQNQDKLEEKLIDLQWRSMRENLLFVGIEESFVEKENTEYVLREFLSTNMNITYDIPFDRVHRLGRYDPTKHYPRPIIAKFERFRDRERVRLAAPRTLEGTNYGVREHFPAEIENKRRELYPVMRRYKQDKQNKVVLVRDKLYVNDVQYKLSTNNGEQSSNRTRERYTSMNKRYENTHQRDHVHSRTFTRRQNTNISFNNNSRQQHHQVAPSASHATSSVSNPPNSGSEAHDFATPNRWRLLREINDENELVSPNPCGKTKASSPLEDLTSVKKTRNSSPLDSCKGNFHSEMTFTISASPREEPMQTQTLPNSSCETEKMTSDTTQCALPTGPNMSDETNGIITEQSVSRDSSPNRSNAVNDEK